MKRILSRLAAALLAAALCLSMLPAALAAGSLAVRAYESSSDRIEKDDRVDLTLHFLMTGVTTADARNKGLDVSRLVDSFSGGGQTVTITSADDQPLEFDAAFSNLTYSGAGKSFRVMAGIGGEYETAEITVHRPWSTTHPSRTPRFRSRSSSSAAATCRAPCRPGRYLPWRSASGI